MRMVVRALATTLKYGVMVSSMWGSTTINMDGDVVKVLTITKMAVRINGTT